MAVRRPGALAVGLVAVGQLDVGVQAGLRWLASPGSMPSSAGSRDRGSADRDAAGELLRAVPGAVTAAYQNRRFVESAVQFLAACAGVRQFIDLGCGLLAPGAVHEVALRIAPAARVAYVDHDPAVLAELDASLADHPAVRTVLGDVRHPDRILSDPALMSLIDTAQPVAVMLTAVLHFVADDADPGGIVAAFMEVMACWELPRPIACNG